MRNFIVLLIVSLFLISCEEVIDVELNDIEPKLVVDANIEWQKGTIGQNQKIRLSLSSNYFDEQFVPVTDATVTVKKLNTSETVQFNHYSSGNYITTDFVPELNVAYELNIIYQGELYKAYETLVPVSEITKYEQKLTTGFDGEDVIRFDFFTNDQPNIENYYYIKFHRSTQENPYLTIRDDEFRDGNEINFLFFGASSPSGEDLQTDELLQIEFMGVSEDYAKYMELLLDQAYAGGGPFSSTPVELKGNIINTTKNQKAFGYFRLSEKDSLSVVIE